MPMHKEDSDCYQSEYELAFQAQAIKFDILKQEIKDRETEVDKMLKHVEHSKNIIQAMKKTMVLIKNAYPNIDSTSRE
jgi:hypothetical protein